MLEMCARAENAPSPLEWMGVLRTARAPGERHAELVGGLLSVDDDVLAFEAKTEGVVIVVGEPRVFQDEGPPIGPGAAQTLRCAVVACGHAVDAVETDRPAPGGRAAGESKVSQRRGRTVKDDLHTPHLQRVGRKDVGLP